MLEYYWVCDEHLKDSWGNKLSVRKLDLPVDRLGLGQS